MTATEAPPTYKIALLGGPSVGKTSIISYIHNGRFVESTQSTIHASCIKQSISVKGSEVVLEIWDTAGQEKYRSIGPLFYRDALACAAVFDITSHDSLNSIDGYINDYLDCIGEKGNVVVIANKSDMASSDTEKNLEEGESFAKERNYPFFVTSAKTGQGIREVFLEIAATLAAGAEAKEKLSVVTVQEEKKKCNC